jgi:hypothetical protein
MNIRILTLIGVMGTMIASAALACDEPAAAGADTALEPFQFVSSVSNVQGSDSDLIDCFYDANRGHPACQI